MLQACVLQQVASEVRFNIPRFRASLPQRQYLVAWQARFDLHKPRLLEGKEKRGRNERRIAYEGRKDE